MQFSAPHSKQKVYLSVIWSRHAAMGEARAASPPSPRGVVSNGQEGVQGRDALRTGRRLSPHHPFPIQPHEVSLHA